MVDAQRVIKRHKDLRSARQTWESHWQRLGEVFLPRASDFITTRTPGDRRMEDIFDASGMEMRRSLSASIDNMLKAKDSEWFAAEISGQPTPPVGAVAEWLEWACDRLRDAIYQRGARFVAATGEVDDELVTFGTGILYIGENKARNGFSFRSLPLRNCCIAENSDGVVDTIYVQIWLTPRQAIEKYGRDAVSEEIRKASDDTPDKPFLFVWAVYPREGGDSSRMDAKSLPFASVVVEDATAHLVSESGYREFPFAVSRWDTASGEVYGRSPAMVALPDANTLQELGKGVLKATQFALDPPMMVAGEAVSGAIRVAPGAITYVDYSLAGAAGANRVIEPMQLGGQLPAGLDVQQSLRDQVSRAFFLHVLGLPVGGPAMTATEVIERKAEFVRVMGAMFGRLESDYTAPIVERCFSIMLRNGGFGDPREFPPELLGQEVIFKFKSPLDAALRKMRALGLAEAMNSLAPLIQADPGMLDHLDTDGIMRDSRAAFGFPAAYLRDEKEVDAMRQQRQEAQAQAAQMQQLQMIVQSAGQAAPAIKAAADAGGVM